jgi:hypothetical protein
MSSTTTLRTTTMTTGMLMQGGMTMGITILITNLATIPTTIHITEDQNTTTQKDQKEHSKLQLLPAVDEVGQQLELFALLLKEVFLLLLQSQLATEATGEDEQGV